MQRKLGKLAPRHDPRTLRVERYLTGALPAAPVSVDWNKKVTHLGMMLNDRLGCCTCATVGHMTQTWTANDGSEVTIPDKEILKAYSAVSGYDLMTGRNDNGAVVLDVLKLWQRKGIGGHRLDAYAAIPLRDFATLRQCCWLFGGVYLGVTLSQQDMDRNAKGQPWTSGTWWDRWRGRLRIVGGHALSIAGYDPQWVYCHTWGAVQKVSWQWLAMQCDEAYACLSGPDWGGPDEKAPSGFDLAALRADLAAVTR